MEEPVRGPGHDEAVVQAFIHARFADLFLGQSRRAQIGLLVAAILTAAIWFSRTRSAWALAWIGAVVAVTLLRYLYTERLVRGFGQERTTSVIVAVLAVNGVMMATPILAFGALSVLDRAAVAIILLGSATASVATTSGYKSVFLAFAAPMLLALATGWALASDEQGTTLVPQAIGFLVFAFLLFLVSIGRQASGIFGEASRFRYGAQQLNRELQHALEIASEANRAKTHFLAAASHDLRQPIHSMNVLVAALTMRDLDTRSREIVDLLDSVNQSLSRQLDSLLDISKLDAGIVKPSLRIERLDQLARAHHAATEPAARERGIGLALQVAHEVSVETDAALLGRVLSNLTDNALKFTRRGGQVRIGVREHGERAVLSVADTGIGIAQAEQARVFAEFYQVGNVERDRQRGLGLGLSIVQRLCQLLGATISLDSEPGVGTTILVSLPRSRASGIPTAPTSVARPSVQDLSVLVVDDELFVRQSMRLLLSELGCTVYLADGTAQAQEHARAARIDVVLSDYRLRDDDSGLSVIRSVQALQPHARAALITGDTAPDRIAEAQSVGVPLLHKPVTLDSLLEVLGSGVSAPRV